MSTTHAFTHIITVGYTPSNRPIKAAISFNLNLTSTSSTASTSFPASTTITFTTTADTSTISGTIVDNANGTPSSETEALPSTQRAAVRANVTGTVTITPSPYECASVTATLESVAEDDGGGKQTRPRTSLSKSAASAMKGVNSLMKTPRNAKAEGERPPAPAVAVVAVAPDQPQLTTPADAESAQNKKLTMAERTAAAKAERERARAKTYLAAEVPDDAPTNWITPADARTTDAAATGTKAGTKKATTGTVKSTLKNMKTAFKTLLLTKPQNTTTHLPTATVTAILDHLLNLIPALHKKYARYDEVDASM